MRPSVPSVHRGLEQYNLNYIYEVEFAAKGNPIPSKPTAPGKPVQNFSNFK